MPHSSILFPTIFFKKIFFEIPSLSPAEKLSTKRHTENTENTENKILPMHNHFLVLSNTHNGAWHSGHRS
jgi:hypothetical protein